MSDDTKPNRDRAPEQAGLGMANSDAWLAAIVESSDDAIIGKTLDSVIRSWNDGARRIFGYGTAEIVGKPIYLLIPAELQHE
jgi:PAS domain S-box-containing protein